MIKIFALAMTVLAAMSVRASNIVVIDSGVDFKHKMIAPQFLKNTFETPDDGTDDDINGYIDDVYGWNFAENNNLIIDTKYQPYVTEEVKMLFEVQERMLDGTATQEDKDWMKEKRGDSEFMKKVQIFGNYTHGTHVAGISIKDHMESSVFGIKLLPTEVKLPGQKLVGSRVFKLPTLPKGLKEKLLEMGLQFLAKQQSKTLGTIGKYVNQREAHVANCSFGTGYPQSRKIVETLYNAIFKEEERDINTVDQLTIKFLKALNASQASMVKNAPKTLFVFAAGNDGLDNDVKPTAPASIREDNTITVAATMKNRALAVFSNRGSKMVDVAAPGVGILSTLPGDETGIMSGTSQAAPYVTNLAAEILNVNPDLSPLSVKEILMGTVDHKSWLKNKVVSEGLVNSRRAFEAAFLSKSIDLKAAIDQSRGRIPDQQIEGGEMSDAYSTSLMDDSQDAGVLPLPSPLQ